MDRIYVDDIEVTISPQENLILAAEKAGVEIPHYCWHPDLSVVASCRMCLVEVGERKPDGTTVMLPRLVPACQTPARPGTVVVTQSEKVKAARAQTLEYLLLNHPLDCSICDQAGECYLQDYTYKFGNVESRLQEPKTKKEDKYHIGDQIALFTDRCVMCTRCVRFTREISGTAELYVSQRGSGEEIEVAPDKPCNNKLAGNVVDLCPVGALCSKDFLYKKRVWWLESKDSVCVNCSTGCSITIDQNENQVHRIRPRANPNAQGSFMCDDGRFGWKYLYSSQRLTAPRIGALKDHGTSPSVLEAASGTGQPASQLDFKDPWPTVIKATRDAITAAVAQHPETFLVLLSPMMTCEEAYLLAKFAKSLHKRVTLALGRVPSVGEDDRYPKDHQGNAPSPEKTKFTIRAEKCPNRRGVELVLNHFQGEIIPYDTVLQLFQRKKFLSAYVVGGYFDQPFDAELTKQVKQLNWLFVQDFLASAVTDAATILLSSATFAEREGTVVNHAGLAQAIQTAVRVPDGVWQDGRILHELAQRPGLFSPRQIRKEMAAEIPAFAAFGSGELPTDGIFLTQNDLVGASK